jgi:hypothetical protein
MTRRIVYGISLWVYLGAFACSIAAVALPNWISYTSPTDNDPIHVSYGLHKRCSSITGQCTPFPQDQDCYGDDRSFCSMWRSTGFLMNFSIIFEVAVLVAYLVILVGGRGTREVGWKILTPLLLVVAAAQLVAMTLVVGLDGSDGDVARLHALIGDSRLTFMITTTASSLGGLWTSRGFSAPSAGLSCCSMLRVFFLRLTSLRLRMITWQSRHLANSSTRRNKESPHHQPNEAAILRS